ncbi:MAG: phage holin family protein [Lachnospiraceae bacterium]|nr:phage holin family protein [Lachnospiraceae bacterium]
MEKYLNGTSIVIGAIGGTFIKALGGYDMLLRTMLCMTVLDYITGMIKAVYQKQLSSGIGFHGILKKIMVFMLIAAANILQPLMGNTIPVRETVIMFFISNEGLSLLENAAVMIPIPDSFRKILLQIRDGNEGE